MDERRSSPGGNISMNFEPLKSAPRSDSQISRREPEPSMAHPMLFTVI